ncbi:hypothetical protein [Fundicoccus culcitae]|uniref:Uncharacterized protein n=1 Tax=Fundicoccus culcitae TaxID=2969821 RepID=A0ABY5P508_9LACT|nr:hypothetical protein [Fundicoccus culcitae]UUX33493.1 hypothetical protein NRE15_11375 [Fundicoccus culcitae]
MKKAIFICLMMVFSVFSTPVGTQAQTERQSIDRLPFEGYFMGPDDYAIEGLLFKENQLIIYVNDDTSLEGHDRVHHLVEFHDFPHPDLMSYTESLRQVYMESGDLPYDLQAIYEEITAKITPEMSQNDVQDLINNRIPGIYYTEKNGYDYFTIASPIVSQTADAWQIQLFDEVIFILEEVEGTLQDQDGVVYQFSGIQPN